MQKYTSLPTEEVAADYASDEDESAIFLDDGTHAGPPGVARSDDNGNIIGSSRIGEARSGRGVGGGVRTARWLLESNELLAPVSGRLMRPVSSHFCLLFCLWLAAIGACFLAVVASLLARHYPYMGIPQDTPNGAAPLAEQVLGTALAAAAWGVAALALAIYYLCICRWRAGDGKAD